MTNMYVPPRYGLIITYGTQRREEMCVILIKMSNKIFNEFSLMSFMYLTLTLHLHVWLMDPPNMPPQDIEVSIHSGLSKIRSRPVL